MTDINTRAAEAINASLVAAGLAPLTVAPTLASAALFAALDLSEEEIARIVETHNAKGGWLIDADELRACAAALKSYTTQGERSAD